MISGEQGRSNRGLIYLSTISGLQDTLSAIAYDQEGLEVGGTQLVLDAEANTGEHNELLFQGLMGLTRNSRALIR